MHVACQMVQTQRRAIRRVSDEAKREALLYGRESGNRRSRRPDDGGDSRKKYRPDKSRGGQEGPGGDAIVPALCRREGTMRSPHCRGGEDLLKGEDIGGWERQPADG